MDKRRPDLRELQEISFWQQLNRQLLIMKRRGKPVKDTSFKSLRSFCLGERLFSKIKRTRVVSDIPLSLVTNLNDVYFVTLNLRRWTRVLSGLLPGSFVLDIERAMAGSLVALNKYHRRYGIAGVDVPEVKEDEELIEYANRYMDAKEYSGLDFPSMIMALHDHKATAVKSMLKAAECKSILRRDGELLYLDIDKVGAGDAAKKRAERVQKIYTNEYLAKVDEILRPILGATWMLWETEVRIMLENKLKEGGNVKESIRQYAESELKRYHMETEMIDNYSKAVGTANIQKIPVAKISPFHFLSHPLPEL